jgi:hypothetical protein
MLIKVAFPLHLVQRTAVWLTKRQRIALASAKHAVIHPQQSRMSEGLVAMEASKQTDKLFTNCSTVTYGAIKFTLYIFQ